MSSNTKKFLLVDASNIDQLFKSHPHMFKERQAPIGTKELKALDKLMLSVINNHYLTDEQKVPEYNKTANFQSVSKELNEPIVKRPIQDNSNQLKTESKQSIYNPLVGVSSVTKVKPLSYYLC